MQNKAMDDDLFGAAEGGAAHSLFLGLLPDTVTRTALAAAVAALRAGGSAQGRWTDPSRFHMTLHYLGSSAPLQRQLVDAAMRAAAAVEAAAFELVLDRAGSFSRAVGWLGCSQPDPGLQQLWTQLRDALVRARVRIEDAQPFTPHLTVLRDARAPLPPQPIAAVALPVREFVLIDSHRSRYELLGRWPLSGGSRDNA